LGTMKVDLRNITPEGCDLAYSEIAEDLELNADGFDFPQPIEVNISAAKSGDEILLQGQVSTTVEMECARCLENFEMDVNPKIQFVVQLLDIKEPQPSEDDDFVILPKTTGEIDISQRVREAILLELPLKPLCSDNCRGLCPMCGTNLNEAECDCTPDKSDERWDSLKQLFDQQ
jgi:uncharacterized protein